MPGIPRTPYVIFLQKNETKVEPAVSVEALSLSPTSLELKVGDKKSLTATILPTGASDKSIEWLSDNSDVVKVSDNGEVSAVKGGIAIVTAKSKANNTKTASCRVMVKSAAASIALGNEKFELKSLIDEATTTLTNAPRSLLSNLASLPVNITAAAGASIKIGSETFMQGQAVDFRSSQTFVVTAPDGTATKYTLAIAAYNPESNPYGVYTAAHLSDVRNAKRDSYKMMNDIILPAREEAGAAATGITDYATAGWLPIAHDNAGRYGFTGTFDGGNFVIDNLYINRTDKNTGLFAATYKATIKNLGVTGTSPQAVTGTRNTGAIVGLSENSSLINCYTTLNISSASSYTGGLVGRAIAGTISNCYATGSVSSVVTTERAYAGGLVGCLEYHEVTLGTISNCYATGSVSVSSSVSLACAGGLVGYSPWTISNCYATGNVSSSCTASDSHYAAYAGGLVGDCFCNISNCYAVGNASATSSVSPAEAGGFVASSRKSTFTKCARKGDAEIKKNNVASESADKSEAGIKSMSGKEMQNDSFTNYLNDNAAIWERNNSKNNGLPYIKGM